MPGLPAAGDGRVPCSGRQHPGAGSVGRAAAHCRVAGVFLGAAEKRAQMLFVALAGTLLGFVCTALIRRRFVDDSTLSYPIGTAAAETLKAALHHSESRL